MIAAAEEAANASTYRAAQSAAQAGAGVGQTECDTTCVASQAAAAAAEAGAAASAKVTSSACAEIEIRGVAALESWTNVTGRYLLQDFIRNRRPVYRRTSYFPPKALTESTQASDPGQDSSASTLNATYPPSAGSSAADMWLFSSEGNWVVAPEFALVMDTADSRRARLFAFSDAVYPHQVAASAWQELGLYDPSEGTEREEAALKWQESGGIQVVCSGFAECGQGLILPVYSTSHVAGGGGFNDSVECFTVDLAIVVFDEALARCRGLDEENGKRGGLATAYTEGQHDVVVSLSLRLAEPSGNAVWIGLRSLNEVWQWTEGNHSLVAGFSKWAGGEPDGRGGDLDPWLDSSVSEDAWWVIEGRAHDLGRNGSGSGAAGWQPVEVQCGSGPAPLSSASAIVDTGEAGVGPGLVFYGGTDAGARFSDALRVLRPMTAEEMAATPVASGLHSVCVCVCARARASINKHSRLWMRKDIVI